MFWPPFLQIEIRHDFFDYFSLIVTFILGVTAIISLWFSRKAFKKSEFDSAMNTSPSIVIKPEYFWIEAEKDGVGGYNLDPEGIIKKADNFYKIVFRIKFSCQNDGRGVAFNVSSIKSTGIIPEDKYVPLYLELKENHTMVLKLDLETNFEELYKKSDEQIPISVFLTYTNDQGNIFCKSIWQASLKLFDKDGDNLKVRDKRLLNRSGKIEYSQKPIKE